ncbi:MAG: 4'-phosphopantetheinyl transferase superfamily protein [Paludibacteraceae bacterium]|nr:4'-phosphopantetheinyl transferase superfamily protein [Paludibacteraceae bacterium]
MQYLIFDDMTECSEQEIARLLPLVSEQRREQALSYKHLFGQYCCLKSYEMLQQLLTCSAASCRRSRPLNVHPTPTFLYNEHGAPFLADGPYFSISHCKQGIAVVVSDSPVGIDIEGIRQVDEGLVRKTMNIEEQAQIQASAAPDREFIRLWTRKEAYVKLQGTGIISDMHAILVNTERVEWQEHCNIEKGYICTIAIKNERN